MKFKKLPPDILAIFGTIRRTATVDTKEYRAYVSALRDLVGLLREHSGYMYLVDTKQFKKDGKALVEIYNRYSGISRDPESWKKLLEVLDGKLAEFFSGKVISHPGQATPFVKPYVMRVASARYNSDDNLIELTGTLFYRNCPGEAGFSMSIDGRMAFRFDNVAIDSVSDASDFGKIVKKQFGVDGKTLAKLV